MAVLFVLFDFADFADSSNVSLVDNKMKKVLPRWPRIQIQFNYPAYFVSRLKGRSIIIITKKKSK